MFNLRYSIPCGYIAVVFALFSAPEARSDTQGLAVGIAGGSIRTQGTDPNPGSLFVEYYNVGGNPGEIKVVPKGTPVVGGDGKVIALDHDVTVGNKRKYGTLHVQVQGALDANGNPFVGGEIRGMNGWQVLGSSSKHPIMPHIGVEPLNVEARINQNVVDDIRKRVENDALHANGLTAKEANTDVAIAGFPNVNNTLLNGIQDPQDSTYSVYYMPMLSAGIEAQTHKSRFIVLGRGGAAIGANLRPDGEWSGVAPAFGAGAYFNSPLLNLAADWTRILADVNPTDKFEFDAMVKPFQNVPLALGLSGALDVIHDVKEIPDYYGGDSTGSTATHDSVSARAEGSVRLTW